MKPAMNPERWKQINEILDTAFELPPEKRAAFLDEACAANEDLRKEIAALLISDERAHSFIESPVEILSGLGSRPILGQCIGPYMVIKLLGAGGMGEVYEAQDTRLKRKVAIKLLHAHLSSDSESRSRLEREARTISSLSHPNICSLYDIGHHQGIDYLVMEYIEGRTLAEVIEKGPIALKLFLNQANGIADGLAAAHRSDVIHRDLKPGNIMVTAEGSIKILDFGLAKFKRKSGGEEHETVSASITQTGMIHGTIPYMSPEQAAGRAVDFRSDQFSFGLILYEMATGKKAFARDTAAQTLAAIISEDPEPLVNFIPKIPAPVVWIVERCLAKDPQERYESTADLAKDLRSLPDRILKSDVFAPVLHDKNLKRQRIWNVIAAVLILILVSAVFVLYKKVYVSSVLSYHRLTYRRGYISTARFAPDGQTIIYSGAFHGEPKALFITRTQGVESRPLGIQNADILSISTSGEMAILLNEKMRWFMRGILAVVPLSGGAPREIADQVSSACWTPDGSSLAVAHRASEKTKIELPLGKVLYETSAFIRELRISPDGTLIAFSEQPTPDAIVGSVVIMDMTGKAIANSSEIWYPLTIVWRNSKELWISAAANETGGGSELYSLDRFGKQRLIQRFPNGIVEDIASSGRALMHFSEARTITVALLNGESQERDLSWLDGTDIADISDDGTSLLLGESGEGAEGVMGSAYLRKTDSSAAIRLGIGIPRSLSRDGKFVLLARPYESRLILLPTGVGETKSFNIEKFRSDNTFPSPTLFPDARRILFRGKENGHATRVYIQDISGKEPYAITEEGVDYFPYTISPDGKFFVGTTKDQKIYIFPTESGTPRPVIGISEGEIPFRWSENARFLYIRNASLLPVAITRLNPQTGERTLIKRWSPSDSTGVTAGGEVRMTPDEKNFVFSFSRELSSLYLVDALPGRR